MPAPQSAKQSETEEEEDTQPELLAIIEGLLPGELDELISAERQGCSVHHCMQKLVRLVSIRHKQGGLAAPPPIVSRVFQELSNGFLAYQASLTPTMSSSVPIPHGKLIINATLNCI